MFRILEVLHQDFTDLHKGSVRVLQEVSDSH